MDPSKSRHVERQTASSPQGQESEDACGEASTSGEGHASHRQSTLDVIRTKTNTGLKKLRGSLNVWRRDEGPASRSGASGSRTSKNTHGFYNKEQIQEKQTPEPTESPRSWGMEYDLESNHFQEIPLSRNESMTLTKESYRGLQLDPSIATQREIQTPVTLKTAQWVLGKHQMAPQDYTYTSQVPKPMDVTPSPGLTHSSHVLNDEGKIPQTLSPHPPAVPPRCPNRPIVSSTIVPQDQHAGLDQHVPKQPDTIAPNLPARGNESSGRNQTNSPPLDRVVMSRNDVMYHTGHYSSFNTGLQGEREDSNCGPKQDSFNYPATYQPSKTPHHRESSAPIWDDHETYQRDDEEDSREESEPSYTLQARERRDAHHKSHHAHHADLARRAPDSPPVLSVHNVTRLAEHGLRRPVEPAPSGPRSSGTNRPVNPGTRQETPVQTMQPPPIRDASGPVQTMQPPPIRDASGPVLSRFPVADYPIPQNPQPFQESPRRPLADRHPPPQFKLPRQNSVPPRSIIKKNTSLQNELEHQSDEPLLKGRALSHHITPNRPAPKPPVLQSTVVQYPGPLKGYTVSAREMPGYP
ncbi:hypothetical protein EGW08_016160, partial [Elysia chlorotica]